MGIFGWICKNITSHQVHLLNEKVAQLALAEDSISELINRRGQEIREQCGDDERAFDSQMKEFIRQQRESVANKCADLYEGHWDDALDMLFCIPNFLILPSCTTESSDCEVR